MDWDDADVRAVLQLVDAAGFDELEIETDRFTLSLRRGDDGAAWTRESRTLGAARELNIASGVDPAPAGATAAAVASAQVPASAAAAEGASSAGQGVPDAGSSSLRAVTTPLPGTFYRSPKPGAPPFVQVGARVTRETVVAIVETMKLMNSVYAGVSGRIVSVAIADGSFVAQNAVLMQIEPGGTAEDA
jgi:acetyl-CoA carboxylase biotin carboxyl carrier protein